MNTISVLIVDDDISKISAVVSTVSHSTDQILSVKQASNVKEAFDWLSKYEFHLLITDLLMPLKHDSEPDPKGGESLIRNMYRRRKNLHVPIYIVGLTQFIDLKNSFHSVWKVWHFDMASEEWKNRLRDLIFHISVINSRIAVNKIETIFVEGPFDKEIFVEAMRVFYPEYVAAVHFETINYGGGASWVERQLIIWAKSLTLKLTGGGYLKAVGVFDDDKAGNNAIERLWNVIKINTSEAQTFSIVKTSYKFSPILKAIRNKGLSFPTSLEEMLGIECWKKAMEKEWLERRDSKFYAINDVNLPLTTDEINFESLSSFGFNEQEKLISLYKVGDQYKESFKKMVLYEQLESKKENFINIGFLLKEILRKCRLLESECD